MAIAQQAELAIATNPLRAGDEAPPERFQSIRRRMALDHCKWDPQVGDTSTLSPFPIFLRWTHWLRLSDFATQLTAELLAAEAEIVQRPKLYELLGLPHPLRAILRKAAIFSTSPPSARVMRFDFHWTSDGWRISEVNSDVPGGFSEASELPLLMHSLYPDAQLAGNPGATWARAIANIVEPGANVALIAAAGFLEDQQVTAYMARQLSRCGVSSHCGSLKNLCWHDGTAFLRSRFDAGPISAVVRFYQAEWLRAPDASPLMIGGRTLVVNPGTAVVTESKRLPLISNRLSTSMPTWRRLLPKTIDPRDADSLDGDRWLLKSAFCNTGDSVFIRSLVSRNQWRAAIRAARRTPTAWVAQERFQIRPVQSPVGIIYPCVGVYTIGGRPAGIYGRYSHTPLIDFNAVDAAVLIVDD